MTGRDNLRELLWPTLRDLGDDASPAPSFDELTHRTANGVPSPGGGVADRTRRRTPVLVGVTVVTLSVVGLALWTLAAIDGDESSEINGTSPSSKIGPTTEFVLERPGIFDHLQMYLVLDRSSVKSGGRVDGTLYVEDPGDSAFVDPGCHLGSFEYGLLRGADYDAELPFHMVVDCSGPYSFDAEQGVAAHVEFRATTATGAGLTPGSYVAVMKIEGRTHRVISDPITVTAGR